MEAAAAARAVVHDIVEAAAIEIPPDVVVVKDGATLNGVNEAWRQQCWCRLSVDPAAGAAVACAPKLMLSAATFAAH